MRHIQNESGAKALLRGRGSGYIEVGVRDEQLEPLHILLTAEREKQIKVAKKLCEDLLATVKGEAEASRVPHPPSLPISSLVLPAQGSIPYQYAMQPGVYGTMPVYSQAATPGYYYNAGVSQIPLTVNPNNPPIMGMMPYGMYNSASQSSDAPTTSVPNAWSKTNTTDDAKQ